MEYKNNTYICMQKTYKFVSMNNITGNIKRIRGQKGYSQKTMADELNMKQASYSRLESEESKLTIGRLQEIAKILDTDISTLLDSSKINIQSQTNNEGSFGYVENLNNENKETTKKLVQTLEEEIQHLKKEIEFLRSVVKNGFSVE